MKRLVLFLVPVICWAASTSITVDQLLAMARSAPGEFAAEALVRIAGMDKVETPRKIALLEEAFHRAGEAQLPYKRSVSIIKVPGPASVYRRVYAQDLDAMSLRLKAVGAMLPIDAPKAREMFLRIPAIKLPRLTCEEFLVYDVDGFYDLLGRIASQSFTPAEIEKGESFRLLQPYVAAVSSAAQVPAAAHLIATSNVSDADFGLLLSAYAKAIGKISGDDRTFVHAASGPQIRDLVQVAQRRNVAVLPLLEAYRLYVVNNMAGPRCADDELMLNDAQSLGFADPRLTDQQGPDAAVYFNAHLRIPPLQEIQEIEVTPSGMEGAAMGLRGCDDINCKAIIQKYSDLVWDNTRTPYSAAQKASPEWQAKLQQFLAAIAAWKPQSPEYAAEHFREKSALYSDVANMPPDAAGRQAVLRAELEYVVKNKAGAENRVQWFLPVSGLIGRVTLDPFGLGKLADDLRNVGDPIITLFVELDAAAPRTPDRIMPLI